MGSHRRHAASEAYAPPHHRLQTQGWLWGCFAASSGTFNAQSFSETHRNKRRCTGLDGYASHRQVQTDRQEDIQKNRPDERQRDSVCLPIIVRDRCCLCIPRLTGRQGDEQTEGYDEEGVVRRLERYMKKRRSIVH